jgi:putative two-component system response regulator
VIDFGTEVPRGLVLIVEDDTSVAAVVRRLLRRDGFAVEHVTTGTDALAAVASSAPDIVLLDWMLPGLSGIDVCRQLKGDPATRLIPVVLLTGLGDRERRLLGISAGADDFLTKPFDADELRARIASLVRLKTYTDELDSADAVIRSLALTVEARDGATDGHCQRLAHFATMLGEALGLDSDSMAALERGGYLHDVGKIGIPDAVLLKRGPLTAEEYLVMQQHTVIGERLCGDLRSLARVRPIIRSHHERLNGSGYPDQLRGDAVPLLAQIVGIVDTFDAITSARPYRAARSTDEACEELRADVRRGKFDEALVAEFLKALSARVES